MTILPTTCNLSRSDFENTVLGAQYGDPVALTRLRSALDDNPALWQSIADLGGHCESVLVSLIIRENVLLRESVLRQVACMTLTSSVYVLRP